MFGNSRIDTKSLVELCRRFSVSLKAGVDIRRNCEREVTNGRGAGRRAFQQISDAVNRGDSFSVGLADTGKYFPVLFHEMVEVGEDTGHLAEVLRQMAEHYQHQLELKRAFRQAISWPVFQLVIALLVVGLLIWIMGMLPLVDGKPTDILGFGLIGNSGLVKYLVFLAAVAAAGYWLYRQVVSGAWWTGGMQKLVMRTPKVGYALETLAMSRFCWSLRMTLDTTMPIRRALELAFNSTHNAHYTTHLDQVQRHVSQGQSLTDSLAATQVFRGDFLNAVRVGEDSGQLPETLGILADHYQDDARRATKLLTSVAGGLVWLGVAGLIIMMIFRIFSFYSDVLNNASRM